MVEKTIERHTAVLIENLVDILEQERSALFDNYFSARTVGVMDRIIQIEKLIKELKNY